MPLKLSAHTGSETAKSANPMQRAATKDNAVRCESLLTNQRLVSLDKKFVRSIQAFIAIRPP